MKNKHVLVLISIFLPLSLFMYLGLLELKAEEPRRAIVAMEMMIRKSYIIPQINGWDYFNKPPLFNWVLVFFFRLTGSCAEWVVRLPGILSFLAMGILNFLVAKKQINKSTAIYSTLFFLTSADIYFYGIMHAGEIDIFYSLIIFAQAICIYLFYEQRKLLLLFISSYLLTAAGILTKGAPSILFQGITLVVYLLLIKREWKLFFSWKHLAGIVVCSVIVAGYFYSYHKQGGDLNAYLINLFMEASQKTELKSSIAGTIANIFIFPLNLIKILLPWSLFFIVFFDRNIRSFIVSNKYVFFLFVFVVANIPIYWFTGKPANRYLYMFFPFIFTITAYRLNNFNQKLGKLRETMEKVFGMAFALVLVGFCSLYFITELYFIELYYLKVSLFVLLLLFIGYLYFKTELNRIYIVTLAVVCLRSAMAVFYFPYRQQHDVISYRSITKELLVLTGNQPILQGGSPYYFESDISLGSLKLKSYTLRTAPLIPYQIPYYLTLQTNSVMNFEEHMRRDKFYLIYSTQVDSGKVQVFKKIQQGWMPGMELCLVKLK